MIYPHIIDAATWHCNISAARVVRESYAPSSRLGGRDDIFRQQTIAAYCLEKFRIKLLSC